MGQIAYTIGRTTSYDKMLADNTLTVDQRKKLGKREISEEFPEGYDGGWVWLTIMSADIFRIEFLTTFVSEWNPKDFSVYELQLPNNWDTGVIINANYPYNNLLVDSTILRKIL